MFSYKTLYVQFVSSNSWFRVTLPSGQQRNYGSLKTLLGFIEDYYKGNKYAKKGRKKIAKRSKSKRL